MKKRMMENMKTEKQETENNKDPWWIANARKGVGSKPHSECDLCAGTYEAKLANPAYKPVLCLPHSAVLLP